ncbi:hypothetical protein BC835DRAFT_1409689 [Cytidiella melzeri]|nr:hypothetical protein BC835DRAFT_1409689 [Cytidiella melzeri]
MKCSQLVLFALSLAALAVAAPAPADVSDAGLKRGTYSGGSTGWRRGDSQNSGGWKRGSIGGGTGGDWRRDAAVAESS